MKRFTYLAFAFSISILATACGSSETEKTVPGKKEICSYTYDHGSSVMEWTAFKFTAKTGVKGTFTTITVKDGGAMESPEELIQSLSFSIPINSVETQNPERNAKIVQNFFGTIATETIDGKVKALKTGGKAIIEITMNKITHDVEGTYTLENGNFAFHSTIDVADWKAIPGIDELNKICKELHTGDDGVSKLWSEVELSFTTNLKSDCE